MRIEGKPAKLGLLQVVLQPRKISAFRKPDSLRLSSKIVLIIVSRDLNLGADRFRVLLHQWKKPVCCRAGDNLEKTAVLVALERSDEIAMQPINVDLATLQKAVVINPGQMINFRL